MLDKQLIAVLEDVFVTEGIIDSLRGLTTKRSLRLAETYISNSLGVIDEMSKADSTIRSIDASKGDVTKVKAYADYLKIFKKLENLSLTHAPKSFREVFTDLSKIHLFLTVDGVKVLKGAYSGATRSRTAQVLYVAMVANQFMATNELFFTYVEVDGNSFFLTDSPKRKANFDGVKAFAKKASVGDFTEFARRLPEVESGLVQETPDFEEEYTFVREDVIDTRSILDGTTVHSAKRNLADLATQLSPKEFRILQRNIALQDEIEGNSDIAYGNIPEAPFRGLSTTYPVKELGYGEDDKPEDWEPEVSEGTIISLLGEEFELEEPEFNLTEDSLKDFITNGVSSAGKAIMKGKEGTGLKSDAVKAFFSSGAVKGITAITAVIAALFLVRYVVTLSFSMRVEIAKYLRETASIIDEQIEAVNNPVAKDNQEKISIKLKALATKFDVDKTISTSKTERVGRDFDETILDGFANEELNNSDTNDFSASSIF